MKLPIKGSGNAVARKLQITRGKEKIGMENKAGIHSSPRLFSQRGENRFTLLLSLSFHSTLTGASEEKSLGIFPHTPVFLGRRVRLDTDVTRTDYSCTFARQPFPGLFRGRRGVERGPNSRRTAIIPRC